jgi:cobalamin synthase
VIGKKEWFKRRKYAGWGLMPATWQGWVYTLIMISPLVVMSLTQVNEIILGAIVVWFVIFSVDMADIMIHVPKDERDSLHEAIAERNALWVILAVLATGVAFELAQNVAQGKEAFVDPVIIIAIIAGLIAKAATNYWLDKNN